MLHMKKPLKVAYILIGLYWIIFSLDSVLFDGSLWEMGTGKSFNHMQLDEWYRIFTNTFFHHSFLHLLANSSALYFVGRILEDKIGSWAFLSVYLFGVIGTSIIYAALFSFTEANGSSPGIFALIACIIILMIHNRNLLNLHFGNWPVNFTFGYFILANFISIHGFIVHIIGFILGAIFSLIFIKNDTELGETTC